MREDRKNDELPRIHIDTAFNLHAEGSALISFGNTRVLCTASVENRVPPFLRDTGRGWITAEYGMLPRSTHTCGIREAAKGKQGGRTVHLDCDLLQDDGGTPCRFQAEAIQQHQCS